jgi:hypothetical protein
VVEEFSGFQKSDRLKAENVPRPGKEDLELIWRLTTEHPQWSR